MTILPPARTLVCVLVTTLLLGAHETRAATPMPTEQVVQAAQAFLATLSQDERQHVVYAYADEAQRARWSNFAAAMSPRGGLDLGQMNAVQRAAVLQLLKTVLSPRGYEKVQQIRLADDDFAANGSKRGPPRGGSGPPPPRPGAPPGPDAAGPRGAGGPPPFAGGKLFGQQLYYVSFLGEPSATSPWMLQFGGHHLALNITISGSSDVMTPSLTGAQPATFKLNGQTIRPLGKESDEALALVQSLDAGQRQQAILGYRVADLVLGPGQDNKKIAPEGLKVSGMTERQKGALLELMAEWAGMMNDAAAARRMAQLKADLNDTWFAWSGATSFDAGANITAYYRIQGPHLVIEYAPQADEPGNHVHTIYRDPTNDYGRAQAAGAQ